MKQSAFFTEKVALACLMTLFVASVQSAQAKPKPSGKAASKASQYGVWQYPGSKESSSGLVSAVGVPGFAVTASGPTRGVYLTRVDPGKLGYNLRMQAGDMLVSLNGQAVQDLSQADRILQSTNSPSTTASFVHTGPEGIKLYQSSANGLGFRREERVNTVMGSEYNKNKWSQYGPQAGRPVGR